MRVVTFAPALSASEQDGGGLAVRGFPMTSAKVDVFPVEITITIVVSVCTLNGDEYDPARYLVATSPRGERLSTMKFGWRWDDNPDSPVKFRAFAQYLPFTVDSEGTYILGLYDDLDAADAAQTFPLTVTLNPAART